MSFPGDCPRIYNVARNRGGLALARALGDTYYGDMVPYTPEISTVERSENDEFIIIASDGMDDLSYMLIRLFSSSFFFWWFSLPRCERRSTGRPFVLFYYNIYFFFDRSRIRNMN